MSLLVRTNKAYYLDNTVYTLTASFVKKDIGFAANGLWIKNDDTANAIYWSINGTDTAGKLLKGESLFLQNVGYDFLYLKGQAGAELYRIIAW